MWRWATAARGRHVVAALGLAAALWVVVLPVWSAAQSKVLPHALTDQAFWQLVEECSEAAGSFQSENLVGNERALQHVVPALKSIPPGGAYLGVAPDQNFTYMVALEPQIAFIVDIRRGNLLEHLMYKAIVELAPTRADFLSWLFSRPRPEGLDETTPVTTMMDAYRPVAASESLYEKNRSQIVGHLMVTHGFDLSQADRQQLGDIYRMFFLHGPSLTYSMSGFAMRHMPGYAEMLTGTDLDGRRQSYLATERHYQWLRDFQRRNLVVPVVGDFAGPRALKAVGRFLREHGLVVSAFYTSNVEQYLFKNAVAESFYRNLETLPVRSESVIIRSALQRNVMDPIPDLLQEFREGRITVYSDVTSRGTVRSP